MDEMDNGMSRLYALYQKDLSCAQYLMALYSEDRGKPVDPDLFAAVDGLHSGLGGKGDICGVLTGGVCLLSMMAGSDGEEKKRDGRLNAVIKEFYDWFEEYNKEYGSNRCDILLGADKMNKLTRCPYLTLDVYRKCRELLEEYEF